jgi:NAD-dependent dihydropyrimidine dehydrogenase PreA subunit
LPQSTHSGSSPPNFRARGLRNALHSVLAQTTSEKRAGGDVYRKLARHLDSLPGGFPPTETGVEIRILRRLFTPDEAALALHLTLIPEEPRVIARRANLTTDEASRRLRAMARRGLIYSIESKSRPSQYMAAQFLIGIWEYHVKDLSRELIRDVHEYMPALFKEAWRKPQSRTVPVGRSITPQLEVLTYERAEQLASRWDRIAVAPCICRRERRMMGEGCDKPEESCLVFGMAADYYRRNGLARPISRKETLRILNRAEEEGLVLQPGNAREAMFICCCCSCCCGILRNIKRFPRPAARVASPFRVAFDPDTCAACGLCAVRCQMEALRFDNGNITLHPDRCLGCGLCIPTCPTESLALYRKPPAEQPKVPRDIVDTSLRLAHARGKLAPTELVMLQVKSKVDRLLARR